MSNEDWLERDREYVSQFVGPVPKPVLVEGEGCVVKDVEGKSYIDFTSGQVCAALGHCHPAIVQAVREQVGKLMHTSSFFTNVARIVLSEKLANITPGNLKKVMPLNTGSESVELALRIARVYTGRWESVAPTQSYFGLTQGAAPLTGVKAFRKGVGPTLHGAFHIPAPYCYRCPHKLEYPSCNLWCVDFAREVIEAESLSGVASWISEPILSAGGIITPPNEYFRRVKKICDEYGILLIMDEAQTGLGRTGKMFGCEHYGVVPDILALSKSLGGGMPVAATITTPEIERDVVQKGFRHATSHTGDPIVCVPAAVSIDIVVKERLHERAAEMGEYLMKGLNDLKERFEIIGDVRGKGLMVGAELVKNRKTLEPADEEGEKVMDLCLEKGLILNLVRGARLHNVLRMVPPLVISKDEIDRSLCILEESVKEVS